MKRLIFFIGVLLVFPVFNASASVFSDNFDTYEADTTINGQGIWTDTSNSWYVRDNEFNSAPNSLRSGSYSSDSILGQVSSPSYLSVQLYFYINSGASSGALFGIKGTSQDYVGFIKVVGTTAYILDWPSTFVSWKSDVPLDTWNFLHIELDAVFHTYSGSINGDGSPVKSAGPDDPDGFYFTTDTTNTEFYIDDVSIDTDCDQFSYFQACQEAGCYWYFSPYDQTYSCESSPQTECGEGDFPFYCQACDTQEACQAVSGGAMTCYWDSNYNRCLIGTDTCGEGWNCGFCSTEETCEAENCFWDSENNYCYITSDIAQASTIPVIGAWIDKFKEIFNRVPLSYVFIFVNWFNNIDIPENAIGSLNFNFGSTFGGENLQAKMIDFNAIGDTQMTFGGSTGTILNFIKIISTLAILVLLIFFFIGWFKWLFGMGGQSEV